MMTQQELLNLKVGDFVLVKHQGKWRNGMVFLKDHIYRRYNQDASVYVQFYGDDVDGHFDVAYFGCEDVKAINDTALVEIKKLENEQILKKIRKLVA